MRPLPEGLPGRCNPHVGPRLAGVRPLPLAARLGAAGRPSHQYFRRRRSGNPEDDGAFRDQLQPLAKHPARLRRDHRLPAVRGRVPGRHRLRDAARRGRPDPGGNAGQGDQARGDGRGRERRQAADQLRSAEALDRYAEAKIMKIDIHAHIVTRDYNEELAKVMRLEIDTSTPGRAFMRRQGATYAWYREDMFDIGHRLGVMDKMGIDIRVLSLSAP